MPRSIGTFKGPLAGWRPLVPFAVLLVLLMLFAVGGMLVIAHEADRSDAFRAREAVTRTFLALIARLDAAAEMNAAAPPIASALSGPQATPSSAYQYLNFTSDEALGFFGTIVLNHDGSAFAGTRAGRPWAGPTLARAAAMIAPIAARLPGRGAGTVHALIRDAHGQALAVTVTTVIPGSGDGSAEPPRRLAMLVPVAVQAVPKILPSLGVEGFRMVSIGRGDNAVAIPVEHGAPIVFAWRPRAPGKAAIARWAPAIAGLLVAALVMLVLAGRANMAATRALVQLAHQDCLTGLGNRSAFRSELDRRQARGDIVALGMIDLNGFKLVNDRYGHLVGDELLQAVAAELVRAAGPDDFVARLGGDEFAWISSSRAAATRFSDDFAERVTRPLAVGALSLRTGASIGVALAQPGMTASALMAAADGRLYEGKRALQPPPRPRRHAPAPV